MAGGKCADLQRKSLDHNLGGPDYVRPGTVYIALSTQPFDPDATGSALDEVVGASYARIAVTNDATEWPAASGSDPATKAPANDIDFGTNTEDWGIIQSAYVLDDAVAGNAMYGADALVAYPAPTGTHVVIQGGTWNFRES